LTSTIQQQRILQRMQEHFEEGRLGLRDLTVRLPPEQLRLLREQSADDAEPWSSDVLDRMMALVALGDSRRLTLRGADDAGEERPQRVLLIGFDAAERRHVAWLLGDATEGSFSVRAVGSVEEARILLEQTGFDAVLQNRIPGAGSGASQLARAEGVSGDTPVLLLLHREEDPELADLGGRQCLVKNEIDAKKLSEALRAAIADRSAAREVETAQSRGPGTEGRDAVTGLADRAVFVEQLRSALDYARGHGKEVAVVALDLDDFGEIDQALGREVADGVLITAAEHLQGALRKSDLVARVGRDDFWVLLRGRDLGDAPVLAAERLLECLARPVVVAGSERTLTASIGIACHPRNGDDADALLRCAKSALGQARAAGGNGYRVYGVEPAPSGPRSQRVADRLLGALERGDLALRYQPRVDARDGRIVAVEALLRWNDAELGPVCPTEFVPVAEQAGRMSAIGAWVMRESCLAHRRWCEAGFGALRLSVNVSNVQLQSASLRDDVVEAMTIARMAPALLEVELSEGALAESENTASALLRELAEIGVGLSLDDFGTGRAALSTLRSFPVRTLKIDPSFVRELSAERSSAPLVDSVLALGRTLGLTVVAEGVETAVQRDALLARGCSEMQGYWFSPAVSEQELLGLLRAGPLGAGV